MEIKGCLIPTYNVLTELQIDLINKNSYVIHHKNKEVIFMQGRPVSHLVFLKSGLVKLHKQVEERNDIILDIISAEKFIGITPLFYENMYPYSASSIEGGELVYINSGTFRDVLSENGAFSVHILSVLSTRIIYLIDRMIALTHKQVPGRLAELLLYFSKEIYRKDTITLPLTRQEIANLVQTSKETVSRILTEFKNDRIIDLDDRIVTLKSIDLLEIINRIG